MTMCHFESVKILDRFFFCLVVNTVTIFTHSIVEQLVQVPKGNFIGGQCVMKKELITNRGRTMQYRLEIMIVRKKTAEG